MGLGSLSIHLLEEAGFRDGVGWGVDSLQGPGSLIPTHVLAVRNTHMHSQSLHHNLGRRSQ